MDSIDEALLDRVCEAPDERSHRLVLADHLQSKNELWGRYLMLALQDDPKVVEEARAARAALERALFGPGNQVSGRISLRWAFGFVHALSLNDSAKIGPNLAPRLDRILQHPCFRLLHTVELQPGWPKKQKHGRELVDVLVARLPGAVRRLSLGMPTFECEAERLSRLYDKKSRLTSLSLLMRGGMFEACAIGGSLVDLELGGLGFDSAAIAALLGAGLRLRSLDLNLGWHWPCLARLDALEPIFRGRVYPGILFLGLFGAPGITDEFCDRVLGSGLLESLAAFGFSMDCLTEERLDRLIDQVHRLRHVPVYDTHPNLGFAQRARWARLWAAQRRSER